MSSPLLRPQARSKQHGQTLAEFAISLPLVLLLLFGILEFGRIFQSWVTLQNAARSAVRYAVTGQYNDQKYDMDWLIPCYLTDQVMTGSNQVIPQYSASGTKNRPVQVYNPSDSSVKPPSQDYEDVSINSTLLLSDPKNNGFARRVYQSYTYKDASNNTVVIIDKWKVLNDKTLQDIKTRLNPGSIRVVALNPDESLYATWYGRDGEDCTPNDDTLQYRKDMLRLPSIYDEARRGAAGLALDTSLTPDGSLPNLKKFLYNYWSNPSVNQENEAWFNVMICSARSRMYSTSETSITNNPDDSFSMSSDPAFIAQATARFHTFRGPGQAPNGNAGDAYVGGACLLKEAPISTNPNMVNNYNAPWADAGSAGERVVIIVTYNHPLVTPIGLAKFIRMQASRSAVNEAFKIVNAERAVGGGGAGNQNIFNTNTPLPATATPTYTFTPTNTLTPTITPQASATPSQTPFDCAKLYATDVQFSGINTIYVKLQNDNIDDTNYLYTKLVWPANNVLKTNVDAYAGFVSIQNQVNWTGYDNKANVGTLFTNSNIYGDSFLEQNAANPDDVYTPGVYTLIPAKGSSRWQITILGLNTPLYNVMNLWELAGTVITIQNPDAPNTPCNIPLTGPAVEPPPPTPFGQVPTATFTPNCASLFMKIQFVEFMPNGDVRLRVTNLSASQPGYLQGFTIQWQAAKNAVPTLKFGRLSIGGKNGSDVPSGSNPNAAGVAIWEGANGGATTAPTTANKASLPEWKQSYTFPPGTVRDVYLHFVGTGADSLSARGVPRSAFNGSKLIISCNPNGTGGNGGSGGQNGDIQFDAEQTPTPPGQPTATASPAPTNTPRNTNTPRPTSTLGPTSTTAPTRTSTNTALPPPTSTPRPTSTPPQGL